MQDNLEHCNLNRIIKEKFGGAHDVMVIVEKIDTATRVQNPERDWLHFT